MRNLVLLLTLFACIRSTAQEYEHPYSFFTNSAMSGDFFYSSTLHSSGSLIYSIKGKIPVSSKQFHSPGNALELTYMNTVSGNWQAAIYYHEIRGMDHFRKSNYLSFWILNDDKNTSLPLVAMMKKDSSLTKKVPFQLQQHKGWEQILIPLDDFTGNSQPKAEDFMAVVFCQKPGTVNPRQTCFIDDIEFVTSTEYPELSYVPELISATGYARHCDIVWKRNMDNAIRLVKIYRSENGNPYNQVGVQLPQYNRYSDFTGNCGKQYSYKLTFLDRNYRESGSSEVLQATTREMSDEELLTMVQEASWRYYTEGAEMNSGMALENIPGRQQMIATGASGFGLMAIITGAERQFTGRDNAAKQVSKIVDFLERADAFHGVFPHFIDGVTGLTEPFFGNRDNGADLVETAFLFQGLLAARQYFSLNNPVEQSIRTKITRLWERAEWDWFRKTPESKFLYWHWSPDQAWVINHPLIGWNETMVTYLLAIASPKYSIPAEMYYTGWANQDSTGWKYRSAWGRTIDGAGYTNGNTYYGIKLDVGVSNGGPLFFTHYSFMGYDPHGITDKYTNYFINNQNIAKINYNYCVENPKHFKGYGPEAWGLTASDGPYDYSANEPVLWQDIGKITPTGALSSFPYTPEESMKALKHYYYDCGHFLWGPYGFRDSFLPQENWCSEIYMGLNQAPIVVMIENYRTGLIWNLFMKDPDVIKGLEKLRQSTNE